MKPDACQRRLARLQREVDVNIGPVLLLSAASAALVLALGLNALLVETAPAQAAPPAQQGSAIEPGEAYGPPTRELREDAPRL